LFSLKNNRLDNGYEKLYHKDKIYKLVENFHLSRVDFMNTDEKDYYQKLRQRVKAWYSKDENRDHPWAKWVLLAPDFFHLLVRLVADPEVPFDKKAKFGAVLFYFISPIDIISELFIGPAGFIEDVVLSAYVLNDFVNEVNDSIIRKHWAGDEDVLGVVQKIIASGDQVLGSGLFRRVKRFLSSR
jgi:uncharacterized membrane protein YkvA (DUF1232 family)